MKTALRLAIVLALCGVLLAQNNAKPSVSMAPAGKVQLAAGGSANLELAFRVIPDFHINSHHPRQDYLIPTVLALEPPAKVNVAEVKYPQGEDLTFSFAPNDKLNVYSGDFSINLALSAPAKTAPGVYPVKGELKYQACDHSACYPPHSIPVEFQVTVVKK